MAEGAAVQHNGGARNMQQSSEPCAHLAVPCWSCVRAAPGTGKTSLVHAVAEETGRALLSVMPSSLLSEC
jgi:hypothetical protein